MSAPSKPCHALVPQPMAPRCEMLCARAAQICPFPKLPVPLGIGQLLARYLRMRVGVTNFFFQGRVRLSMHPLLNKMPVVGAIKARAALALSLSELQPGRMCRQDERCSVCYYRTCGPECVSHDAAGEVTSQTKRDGGVGRSCPAQRLG